MKTSPEPSILFCGGSLLLLSLLGNAAVAGQAGQTVGLAYDLESDELMYRETHCLNADGSEREVVYQDAEGRLIARKSVDYASGQTTPSFVQHNHYSGESIQVGFHRDGVSMSVMSGAGQDETRSARVQPSEGLPVVIDAGFDAFVRQHWDGLEGGESREFQFPLADRERLVDLRIKSRECSYATESDRCFQLDVANWFLRMLVKPIELGYHSETRQLTRFRGLSNIGDENGNGLVVDIRYSYDELPAQICGTLGPRLTHGAFDISSQAGQS